MVNIEVNGNTIQAREGQSILEALKDHGINVPTLCHLEDLFPTGACRMCVVEVEGQRALVPSCAYPVSEGMKLKTHSPRAIRARKTIIELLLADHPDDCLYCGRNKSCQLQALAEQFGVRQRRFKGSRSEYTPDVSSPSISRDPEKCILCGRCVRVCEEVQGVSAIDFVDRGSHAHIGTAFEEGLNISSCINCGQCINVCPTGALIERSYIKEVLEALEDPEKHVVVQHAPAVSVSLAEEFGLPAGKDVCGVMTAAMRLLGFDSVFDTSFTADLTIMEEASELAKRVAENGTLPMFTSCSPGWIKFVETFYPEFISNLSTCKSPQQMMGAIIKTHYAKLKGVDPSKIYSVSIMPCTAKKFESHRGEMSSVNSHQDIDAVLTTRELARVIRMRGVDLAALEPSGADTPFGERSGAGKLFGASGGVMEAAVRTAHFMLTGKEMASLDLKAVRGFDGVKKASVRIADLEVNVAVVSGLGNARKVLEEIKAGRMSGLHFMEVMTCPGGCINGGGQPLHADPEAVKARMQALYKIDSGETLRTSHNNMQIQRLYKEFLGEPLGHLSHELLHTSYGKRDVLH